MNITVKVPSVFTQDWLDTCDEAEEVEVIQGQGNVMTITAPEYLIGDLIDRAYYYSTMYGEDERENRRYVDSARRLLKRFGSQEAATLRRTFHSRPVS